MTFTSLAVVAALVIVAVLAAIAARLVFMVYRQEKTRKEKLAAQELANQQAQQQQRAWINKSIQILAQALQNNELTLTEASIRITGLLESLDVNNEVKTEFSAFFQLRDKTSHIPYLEAWKQLSAAEQRKFDIERLQQEASFNDFVMDAAKRILGRSF
jgi:type II secretory pathway pseudopilin PulG